MFDPEQAERFLQDMDETVLNNWPADRIYLRIRGVVADLLEKYSTVEELQDAPE